MNFYCYFLCFSWSVLLQASSIDSITHIEPSVLKKYKIYEEAEKDAREKLSQFSQLKSSYEQDLNYYDLNIENQHYFSVLKSNFLSWFENLPVGCQYHYYFNNVSPMPCQSIESFLQVEYNYKKIIQDGLSFLERNRSYVSCAVKCCDQYVDGYTSLVAAYTNYAQACKKNIIDPSFAIDRMLQNRIQAMDDKHIEDKRTEDKRTEDKFIENRLIDAFENILEMSVKHACDEYSRKILLDAMLKKHIDLQALKAEQEEQLLKMIAAENLLVEEQNTLVRSDVAKVLAYIVDRIADIAIDKETQCDQDQLDEQVELRKTPGDADLTDDACAASSKSKKKKKKKKKPSASLIEDASLVAHRNTMIESLSESILKKPLADYSDFYSRHQKIDKLKDILLDESQEDYAPALGVKLLEIEVLDHLRFIINSVLENYINWVSIDNYSGQYQEDCNLMYSQFNHFIARFEKIKCHLVENVDLTIAWHMAIRPELYQELKRLIETAQQEFSLYRSWYGGVDEKIIYDELSYWLELSNIYTILSNIGNEKISIMQSKNFSPQDIEKEENKNNQIVNDLKKIEEAVSFYQKKSPDSHSNHRTNPILSITKFFKFKIMKFLHQAGGILDLDYIGSLIP